MTQEHLLSTQNIKDAFVQGRLGLYTEIPAEAIARNEENFDSWLAAHDAEVANEAMIRARTLTDEEARDLYTHAYEGLPRISLREVPVRAIKSREES